MMIGKKGDKTLNMVFTIFVLVLVSVVVLALFFKVIGSSTHRTETLGNEEMSRLKVDTTVQECKNLCEKINGVDSAINFCGETVKIDYDGDAQFTTQHDFGRWKFCEDKIPCFVLAADCQNDAYNGYRCREIIKRNRPDLYAKLEDNTKTGGCGLPLDNCANWIYKFGFDLGVGEEYTAEQQQERCQA
jgi:hypothetical protein